MMLRENSDTLVFEAPRLRSLRIEDSAHHKSSPFRQTFFECLDLLGEAQACGEWYDYGAGYYYQSSDRFKVSGRRDTTHRLRALGLDSIAKGRRVLEVGCNSGFLSAELGAAATSVYSIEPNPYMYRIAENWRQAINSTNVSIDNCRFEDLRVKPQYDVVVALSNHSTADGVLFGSTDVFFERCNELLCSGGLLVVEFHSPRYEAVVGGLDVTLKCVAQRFEVLFRGVLLEGTCMDRGREFMVGKKRIKKTHT